MSYIMVPLLSTTCTALDASYEDTVDITLTELTNSISLGVYNSGSEARGRETAGLWVQ